MARVLVTGANGFLGSWVTRALVQAGHQTQVLVRRTSDLSELSGIDCEKVYGDVTDPESLRLACKGQDAVFHLAGVIAYKASDRPLMDKVNVQGTQNVILACANNNVSKLIYLSSVVAVGAGFTKSEVLNENSTYNLQHLNLGYFETKRLAEAEVAKATQNNKIQSVILNPSTIYGKGDAKKGSRKTQVKVARGEFPFYTTGGVSVVAVEDVVQAILTAWQRGRNGERYILSGDNLTIQELFSMIAKEANVPPPKILMPSFLLHGLGKVGDFLGQFGAKTSFSQENAWTATLYHWFDHTKAKKELGFNPRPAEVAIKNSVEWMKQNSLLKK